MKSSSTTTCARSSLVPKRSDGTNAASSVTLSVTRACSGTHSVKCVFRGGSNVSDAMRSAFARPPTSECLPKCAQLRRSFTPMRRGTLRCADAPARSAAYVGRGASADSEAARVGAFAGVAVAGVAVASSFCSRALSQVRATSLPSCLHLPNCRPEQRDALRVKRIRSAAMDWDLDAALAAVPDPGVAAKVDKALRVIRRTLALYQ
mmetsp:Transcript_42391/g.127077  ORF Transcript_42391/g.127077 Transcript_42391/m.127077 type:complete len:206 (-) Transcript_42391:1111-1728(-)